MKKLTNRKVETTGAGTYDDGAGLRLVVRPGGSRSWVLRYQMQGRRRDMGLGRFPEISLGMARERAFEARRQIALGVDPLAEKARARRLLFRDAALALLESRRPGWRNAKHAAQWQATLETYVFPALGGLDVRQIETQDVLRVLRPIWTTKAETAGRVRQRIEAVLDYATALKTREGENPARWRGHLDHLLPRPATVRQVRHHPALDWRALPAFMATLLARDGLAARALAFTILTAARSGEVRGLRWGEIDPAQAIWTVPGERMKAGLEHRVPLVPAALERLPPPAGDQTALIFPGAVQADRPLSEMTLLAVLKRMGRSDLTVHGFRSTFRDWAGESTAHAREVIEAALAHRLKDKAEAAYARGDLFVKRRLLMQDWADFALATAGGVPAGDETHEEYDAARAIRC